MLAASPTGAAPSALMLAVLFGVFLGAGVRQAVLARGAVDSQRRWAIAGIELLGAVYAVVILRLTHCDSLEDAQRWLDVRTALGLVCVGTQLFALRLVAGTHLDRLIHAALLLLAVPVVAWLGGFGISGQVVRIEYLPTAWGEVVPLFRHGSHPIGLFSLVGLGLSEGICLALALRMRRTDPVGAVLTGLGVIAMVAGAVLAAWSELGNGGLPYVGPASFAFWMLLFDHQLGREERDRAAAAVTAIEQLRTTARYSPIGKATLSLDGRYLDANPALCKLLGRAPEELLGRRFQEFTHPDDHARDEEASATLIAGKKATFELEKRYLRRDGSTVWVQVNVSLVRSATGAPLFLISQVQDVTRRRLDAEQLREGATQLRAIADNVPKAMTYQLEEGLDGRVRYLFVSRGVRELFGLEVEEVLADPAVLRRCIDEADIARLVAAYGGGTRQLVLDETLRMRRPGGGTGFVRVTAAARRSEGNPVIWDGVMSDVTDSREAEERLRRATAQLEAVVTTTGDAVVTTDSAGTIRAFNAAAERIFGHAAEDVIGRDVGLLLTEAQRNAYPAQLKRYLASGRRQPRQLPMQLSGLRRDGTSFDAELSLGSWRYGEETHLVGVVRDVTERRRLEAALQQHRQLELVGRLAGGIAHDFNNLLTVIRSSTDLIVSELGASPLADDVIAIRDAADRAAALTAQLLSFARRGVHAPRRLALDALLRDEAPFLRRALRDDIALELELQAASCHVEVDRTQLGQVLTNLVLNARDAMATGGRIRIATCCREVDAAVRERWTSAPTGRLVELCVHDDGEGMTPEVAARAFEPFFTTKRADRGTGLGLAVVHGVIQQSRGHIELESAKGQGSTFRIWLPCSLGTRPEEEESQLPAAPATFRSASILLVEDDDAVRATVEATLRRAGHRVTAANGASAALQLAASADPPFELLLTDVVMPGRSGRELADALTRLHPSTRVLFMSGYTDDTVLQHGIREGEVSFLAKPFTSAEVLDAVAKVLQPSAAPAQPPAITTPSSGSP